MNRCSSYRQKEVAMIGRSTWCTLALLLGLIALHGCDDIIMPAYDFGGGEPALAQEFIVLEADQVYPREGPVGTEIIVFGRGRAFPSGFYRVVFTGNVISEFYQAVPTNELAIDIPTGARSGPFGFVTSGRPHTGVEISSPSADGQLNYTVREPGFIVTQSDLWIPNPR